MLMKKMVFENLNEAIEIHDTLNSDLFDENQMLKPEIKEAILNIANFFKEDLKNDGLEISVEDIVLLGSNASYNYTENSDIDIHIIVDTEDIDCDEDILNILFNAYKSLFNNKYDIHIKGYETEIYIELNAINAQSNGIYSVLHDLWLKQPELESIPKVNDAEIDSKLKEFERRFFDIMEDKDQEIKEVKQEDFNSYIKKRYRQLANLNEDAELNKENIDKVAFNRLCNEHIIYKETLEDILFGK